MRYVNVLFVTLVILVLGSLLGACQPITTTAPTVAVSPEEASEALSEAVKADEAAEVQRLLEAGADANVESGDIHILLVAAGRGNADVVKQLIAHGSDINAQDPSGQTPLSYASQTGRLDVVELLLAEGADISSQAKDGNTPLKLAVSGNHVAIVELLIDKGADVNQFDERKVSPLMAATLLKNTEIVSLLIANGANLDFQGFGGHTALHVSALFESSPEAAQLLLEAGARVDLQDGVGWTPLDIAVREKNDEVAQILRDAQPEASVEPIRVGSTVPLTGFLAPTGGKIHPLIGELFLKRLNDSGGLLGRPVEWIALDDESSPAKAAELYERLITEEKVDLIIGPHGSDSNLAAMNVAEKYGMVFPHHTSGLTFAYTYERHFHVGPSGLNPNLSHAEKLFEALESTGTPPRTVAFVISQYGLDQFMAHGHEGAGGAVDVAKARGYEVVLDATYPPGTTDFSAIADQVKTADADFLYVLGVGLDGLNLIKALQTLDYHPPALYPAFSPLGPWIATGENVLGILAFVPYEPYLSYPDAAWLNEAYTAAATEAGLRNTALDTISAESWATWQVLIAGVEGAGSLDQAAIADWLQHNTVETTMGPLTFDPESQNYGPDLYGIAQIQDHKWVMVYPPELATADYTVQYSPGE